MGPCRRVALGALAALLLGPAAARADDVLGLPCTTQADGTRACIGDLEHRIPSFDGVPLDANLYLPPTSVKPPYPLIVGLHGFGGDKSSTPADPAYAKGGYAVLQYSARGFGMSCGLPVSRASTACAQGYSHLADIRYEPRDTEYLSGLLADTGLIDGQKIGVTGTSYGAGQSLMLATLKDRMVTMDYKLVPWRSPKGKPMAIAAAAPNWAWSDLATMLVPQGRSLDYSTDNAYDGAGDNIGTPKLSYVGLLFAAGSGLGNFSAPSSDFTADADGWVANFELGDPYTDYDHRVIDEIVAHHSPYTIEDLAAPSQREAPAPIFDNTSWTDDLLPPTEQLVYRNRVLARYPGTEYDLLFSDGAGHPRASIGGTTTGLAALQRSFFDRLLLGRPGRPLGIRTYTQRCGGSTVTGPFDTASWGAQHPGEVRFASAAPHSISQTSDPAVSSVVDPIASAGSSCDTVRASDSPLAATYRLPASTGPGYTLLGSPTVIAKIAATTPSSQVDARLWDVSPDGSQSFITRVAYRPRLNDSRAQVFQLHPNGWHVAAGHVVKLELVGEDSPYLRQSNAPFTATVSDLQLRLPVREAPGTSAQVLTPAPFLDRHGTPLPASKLAATAAIGDTPRAPRTCASRRRIVIHVGRLRHAVVRVGSRRLAVRRGRAIVDLRGSARRAVTIRVTGTRRGYRVMRRQTFHPCTPRARA